MKGVIFEGQIVGFNPYHLSEKSIFLLLLVSSKRSNRVYPLRRRVINLQKCMKVRLVEGYGSNFPS
jgi:hypothetical protein